VVNISKRFHDRQLWTVSRAQRGSWSKNSDQETAVTLGSAQRHGKTARCASHVLA
jgi:hypothetical protein